MSLYSNITPNANLVAPKPIAKVRHGPSSLTFFSKRVPFPLRFSVARPESLLNLKPNLIDLTLTPLLPQSGKVYDLMYYLKGSAAGGICCSITHGALTPVDVVKTRIQLDPIKYNSGLIGGFKTVIAEEGTGALLTGLGATVGGYFVQGWFKFGGVEFFKINIVKSIGDER